MPDLRRPVGRHLTPAQPCGMLPVGQFPTGEKEPEMPDDQDQDVDVSVSPSTSTPEVAPRKPYMLVMVSDFGCGGRLEGLTPVDKENFARVFSKARPTLAVAVKDPFGEDGDWEFELAFDSIKAFDPDGLLAQVPGARARLEVRNKIVDRGKGIATSDDLDNAIDAIASAVPSLAWIRAATTPAEDAGGGGDAPDIPAGGSILDLVDDPGQQARVSSDVERLAAAAGDSASRLSAAERGRLNAALERIDNELGQIADALLKHADVRRLETAWRGLKFLIDRMDFREGNVRLCMVDAPRDEAVAAFADHVVTPAHGGDIPTPGLIIFDHTCGNNPADIAMLDELAQQAKSLPVPVAFALDVSFFNIKSFGLLKSLPNLSGLVESFQFAKWKSLRDKPYSKALVPTVGRFVLRVPHEPRGDGKGFVYTEKIEKARDVLWAGAHLAIGVCAARSFANHGWPTRMLGAEAGKIDDLPVVPNPKNESKPFGPGDLTLPDRRIEELPLVGINFLQSVKDTDFCYLLGGVSAARPVVAQKFTENQARLEISLPYQQFSNITSAYICEEQPKLHHQPPAEIQKHLMLGLKELLKIADDDPDESIMVGVGEAPDAPGQTVVQVRVTPPARIVPGGLHIEFGFAVPK